MKKLLSKAESNAKLAKNSMFADYIGVILYMLPANLSGFVNMCPKASLGCIISCLNLAGRAVFNTVQTARLNRTKFYFYQRLKFLAQLRKELTNLQKLAARKGKIAYARLNGTSDVFWFSVIKDFPKIMFYDYSKRIEMLKFHRLKKLTNYDLTLSGTEDNHLDCIQAWEWGYNVAIVFDEIPEEYCGIPVINGIKHDLRFLDPKSTPDQRYIVGLKAIGKARKDKTGFVRRLKTPASYECHKVMKADAVMFSAEYIRLDA